MSLFDAFLEEEMSSSSPVIKRDVFFALRTDGVAGSGTPEDPSNGSSADLFGSPLVSVE